MQWAKWVLKQTESEWREVKPVERVIYNLNKQAVSCAFCFNCGSSLWKRTERSRKTSLLEPVNVLHFWWQPIDLKQTIDYCKINLQLNDKSFPLEFSHLSLWRDGLDVCHVAGDRQDVELVINDNTVFAGCKWQNESENSETKSIKVSNLKKKRSSKSSESLRSSYLSLNLPTTSWWASVRYRACTSWMKTSHSEQTASDMWGD